MSSSRRSPIPDRPSKRISSRLPSASANQGSQTAPGAPPSQRQLQPGTPSGRHATPPPEGGAGSRRLSPVPSSRRLTPDGSGDTAPRSSRRSKVIRKKRDVAPILMVGAFILAGVGVAVYFPMQKKTCLKAVASERESAFDAAYAVAAYGVSVVPNLIQIIESGAPGAHAAAATLALIARQHGAQPVVDAIKGRLAQRVGTSIRASYALALGQIRGATAEALAAELAADSSEEVRRAAVVALARAQSSPGRAALATALGDSDDAVRQKAQAALADLARTDVDRAASVVAAAIASNSEPAQAAAARLGIPVAAKLTPAQVMPLLKSPSADVRVAGLELVGLSLIATSCKDEAAIAQVIELADVHDQPPQVKEAALKVALTCRLASAGPKALDIMRSDPDFALRARAAMVVGQSKPEGALEALVDALRAEDATREFRAACLTGIGELQKLDGTKALDLTRVLVQFLDGEDEVLKGLALMALDSATGMKDSGYSPDNWKTWLARREFEIATIVQVRAAFESIRKQHAAAPDVEKTVKAVNAVGEIVQKIRNNAHPVDQPAMDAFISEMVQFNRDAKKSAQ